jgi:hypothetical protein
VYAVIDDAQGLDAAVDALFAAGHDSDDVTILCGAEGVALLDPDGSRHGRLGRLVRTVQNFGPERQQLREVEEELWRGHFAVGVHVTDGGEKDRAARVLVEHGGHFVHHDGQWEIEKIAP